MSGNYSFLHNKWARELRNCGVKLKKMMSEKGICDLWCRESWDPPVGLATSTKAISPLFTEMLPSKASVQCFSFCWMKTCCWLHLPLLACVFSFSLFHSLLYKKPEVYSSIKGRKLHCMETVWRELSTACFFFFLSFPELISLLACKQVCHMLS